jgi:hypothetical protein
LLTQLASGKISILHTLEKFYGFPRSSKKLYAVTVAS